MKILKGRKEINKLVMINVCSYCFFYYHQPPSSYAENMVVDLSRCFPLLLLLALWEPACLLCTQPKGFSKARWFEIQHVQISPQQCNTAMRGVNNYTRHCKQKNTFLHESFQNVAATCGLRNITCKNGWKNCHKSAEPVSMTDCIHTGAAYPDCRYHDAVQHKFFIVACERPKKDDPPYQLVPVHLDKTVSGLEYFSPV